MTYKNLMLLCLSIFALVNLSSCGECDGECCKKLAQPTELKVAPQPWQPLYDDVMRVHDEVMPEMGKMKKLASDLDRYALKYSEKVDDAQKAEIESLKKQLKKGETAMWDWMHDFKQPVKEQEVEEVEQYLLKELDAISDVSELMKSGIKDAQSFLQTNGYY